MPRQLVRNISLEETETKNNPLPSTARIQEMSKLIQLLTPSLTLEKLVISQHHQRDPYHGS